MGGENSRSLVQLVRECPQSSLSVLGDEELERLRPLVKVMTRPADALIFEEGDSGVESFFLCKAGAVQVFKRAKDGGTFVLRTARSGGVIGLGDMLAENASYTVSARTMEQTSLIAISREQMLDLLQRNPDFCLRILREAKQICLHLEHKLFEFVERPAKRRMAHKLVELARTYGERHDGVVRIAFPLTNKALAEMLGTTPETISTLLGELKQEHVLERRGHHFVIRDLPALESMS